MANSHTQSLLWRGLTHFANGMLFLLWNGAVQAASPAAFPESGNALWQAIALTHGANATWIDFAIAPDRKTVYVLTEVTASTGSAVNSIRALDTSGKLLRWRHLREASKASRMTLYFTDQGELLWNEGEYFHFIDPDKLTMSTYPQCRKTAHPLLKTFNERGQAHGIAWRDDALKKLRAKYGLGDADPPRTGRKAPDQFWHESRVIRDRTSSVAAEFSQALYFENMLPFARNTAPPLVGIQVTYSGGQVVERYVKLNADGNTWYCELGETAQTLDVRWSRLAPAAGTAVKGSARDKGSFTEDGRVRFTTVKSSKTSTYAEDVQGNIRYDFDIEVSGLGDLPPQRMLFKNTAPVRAHDQAMRLANGAVLIRHLNRLFIVAAKPK